MTIENAKELLPIIKAFAEGKKIEIRNSSGVWVESNNPSFELSYDRYHIKEEPKCRTFKSVQDALEELKTCNDY